MSRRFDPISRVDFEPVRRDLEGWRRSRAPGSRIPGDLWKAAVGLAREHGVSKTAMTLRLDYYTLKDRLEASGHEPTAPRRWSAPAFVEVPLGVSSQAPDCVLELENDERGRLRIELRGRTASDIELLARSLWSAAK